MSFSLFWGGSRFPAWSAFFLLLQCGLLKPEIVIANGQETWVEVPCSIEVFLQGRGLRPRSVVVEHNGDAVAPSEFSHRQLKAGDRLEIVRIVAGG